MATYCVVSVPFGVGLFLVIWCTFMSWEREERDGQSWENWEMESVWDLAKLQKWSLPSIVRRRSGDSDRSFPLRRQGCRHVSDGSTTSQGSEQANLNEV
jgi:hypothetical protein